jgi:hypothetical protein
MDETLLFSSVTCFQEYTSRDPFVLGTQPLDMNPLSLCWNNKMLLPAKSPQCPISQLATFHNTSFFCSSVIF